MNKIVDIMQQSSSLKLRSLGLKSFLSNILVLGDILF